MSKFTRRPKPAETPAVNDFIVGAEQQSMVSDDMQSYHTVSYNNEPLPWEQPGVRADVLKLYNLRLTEPYLLKLKYIAEHTPDSMQKFCLDALLPVIDVRVAQLTKGRSNG